MNFQELIQQKTNELQNKNVKQKIIDEYLAHAIELAFIRTLSVNLESLSDEQYQQVITTLNTLGIEQGLDTLSGFTKNSNEENERLFTAHLVDVLNIKI